LKTTRARENEFKDFVVDNGSLLKQKDAFLSTKNVDPVRIFIFVNSI
jgi:hypothetical protein